MTDIERYKILSKISNESSCSVWHPGKIYDIAQMVELFKDIKSIPNKIRLLKKDGFIGKHDCTKGYNYYVTNKGYEFLQQYREVCNHEKS